MHALLSKEAWARLAILRRVGEVHVSEARAGLTRMGVEEGDAGPGVGEPDLPVLWRPCSSQRLSLACGAGPDRLSDLPLASTAAGLGPRRPVPGRPPPPCRPRFGTRHRQPRGPSSLLPVRCSRHHHAPSSPAATRLLGGGRRRAPSPVSLLDSTAATPTPLRPAMVRARHTPGRGSMPRCAGAGRTLPLRSTNPPNARVSSRSN